MDFMFYYTLIINVGTCINNQLHIFYKLTRFQYSIEQTATTKKKHFFFLNLNYIYDIQR